MPTKTEALCDWIAGLVIGLMPLLAHLILHFGAKPTPDWDDNWSADLLFISITNSGLCGVTEYEAANPAGLGCDTGLFLLGISAIRSRCDR